MNLDALVRSIPDFPKPGILFRDISPLLASPAALHEVARKLVEPFDLSLVEAFVGIESRGFILAALLAGVHSKGFLPLRKAGKLPPPVQAESYNLEYGEATLEIAPGRGRVLVIDDVLATGGTLSAAVNLCEIAGYDVKGCAVLIDLPALNQFRFKGQMIHSLLSY
jgi:adenine phosphoribosyltransferase